MKEMFGEFKRNATDESHIALYEKMALAKESLKIQFQDEFPDLDPDLFLKSRRWLELSGTTHDDDFAVAVPTEVEMWVTRQLTALIESI